MCTKIIISHQKTNILNLYFASYILFFPFPFLPKISPSVLHAREMPKTATAQTVCLIGAI